MFKDFGFKLVVVDALLDKQTSFGDELQRLKERKRSAV